MYAFLLHDKTFGVVTVSYVIKWDLGILIVVDAVTEIEQKQHPNNRGQCRINYIWNVQTQQDKHVTLRMSSYEICLEQIQPNLPTLVADGSKLALRCRAGQKLSLECTTG